MKHSIFLADAVKWSWGQAWLRQYTGELFHAMLCDSPYHLTITQRFGGPNSAPAKFGKDGSFGRLSKGFMGQSWDGGGVSFDPRTWEGFAECLYPGGFLMTFGGSRTYHRIALAMEEAGLVIHPTTFLYSYGSGWPKATRIRDNGQDVPALEGHRYGLQALKPAVEPVIIAQKPYSGRPVDSITATGAGAWNIEAGRIGTDDTRTASYRMTSKGINGGGYGSSKMDYGRDGSIAGSDHGRWPSNLILQHFPGCNGQCVEGCPVKLLGEMSGESASPAIGSMGGGSSKKNIYGDIAGIRHENGHGDSGTAARFFYQADFVYEVLEQLQDANPLYYTAKPSQAEREAGLEALPDSIKHRVNAGGLENEPRFAPVPAKNIHPTVKPISLTKYLASLLLPPVEYAPRRILVPFCGSGSEMIGAILAGWDEVIGLEITEKYIPIAEARLEWWSQWPGWGQTDVRKILSATNANLPMFNPGGDCNEKQGVV